MEKFIHSLTILVVLLGSAAHAQIVETQCSDIEGPVLGRPYEVPEVKVYLTDEETNRPFAGREVLVKYYWMWDVLKSSPETDRISNILSLTVKGMTDEAGVIVIPARVILPSRPIAPGGSELSKPRFQSMGISINDEKHSVGLAIYDAVTNLLDDKGEVHRIVMLYPRPK